MKKNWLILSIISLAFAGLQTLIVVFARVPVIQDIFSIKDLFAKALVVHVNLSILFWFLTMGIVLNLCFNKTSQNIDKIFFRITIISFVLFIISPFLGGSAILNNYIPVINNLVFFIAISLFLSIITIYSAYFLYKNKNAKLLEPKKLLIQIYNIIIVISIVHFFLSYKTFFYPHIYLPDLFEIIFWGQGHILQYAFVSLMVLSYFMILEKNKIRLFVGNRVKRWLIYFHIFFVLYCFDIYFNKNLVFASYKSFFTTNMIIGLSVLPTLIIIFVIPYFFKKSIFTKGHLVLRNCLLSSIFLFLYGGLLGLKIKISNTVIPAHYHGSNVAITLALIGITYLILEQITKKSLRTSKLAFWQPILYGFGQFIHITGLAISGGYGALRKSPDAIYNLPAKFWLGVMGAGGTITMISGIMFLIICYKILVSQKKQI